MIAIVLLFQSLFQILFRAILSLRHFAYGFSELRVQFFLGNATQCLKFFGHTVSSGWLNPLNTLTCENLVTPVRNTKRR